ncbi:C4-dicarboxylate ABC transporter [Marinihelvus fidelis]|uniref:C4-dicarboxylate ABC transporter n=1 Tax=Marinihelvus fidelis TaxID=2613842 RepID=A0A5N0TAR9_9GAMM|nr:TRAP transporter substrate-binding protein DctP [Marinihelvus fidelis]KAA9130916.1 C4-dicarboxylate ABC transporter [Marinihelvus fidelis]
MNRTILKALTVLVACASLAPAMAAADMTFKIATVVPEGSSWMTAMRAGAEDIEARTEGRVKFKFYGGGVQGNDAQVRRKMRVGQLHGGAFTSGAMRDFHPDMEIYGLPLLFRGYDEARQLREQFDPILYQRLEDAGYVTFGFAGGGFAYMASNTRIANRDDMEGLKIWIPEGDQVARAAADTLGIAPVTLPLTDVLTGLQTELIDTVMGPPVGMIVMQWHSTVEYITDFPIAYVYAGVIIDKRHFGKISEQDQAVVHEVMGDVYRGFDEAGEKDNAEALDALFAGGIQRVDLTDAEKARWRELLEASNREAGNRGAFDLELLDSMECALGAIRGTVDAGECSQ